jgi:GNAT superfamily N-acetyltransferase
MTGAIRIVETQPAHFEALETLQKLVFADIPGEEAFTADLYREHLRYFPEGQMTALAQTEAGERVVGSTTTMQTSETFEGAHPYYFDFIGGGTLATHDPNGEWLYGIDVGVHPEFRGRGIGKRLYAERRKLVRRLNLRGELVAGLLPGYPRYRGKLSVEDYAGQVAAGELRDPTLSMQLGVGFRLRKLLYGYVTDARSDNVVTLIVRENPDYRQ